MSRRGLGFLTVHPALRTFADELRAVVVRLVAYVCGLAALALIAAKLVEGPAPVSAAAPVPRPEWLEIGRPIAAFALSIPEVDDTTRYAIRRNAEGGGRKDILSFGDPGADGPAAMVELYRPGSEIDRFEEPAAAIAARAEGLRLIGDIAPAGALASKLGPFTLMEFTGERAGTTRRCLGFVRVFDEPRLQIAGWYCNRGIEIVDRGALACALDRLTLLSAGSEPKTGELFARAELKRKFCGQRSPLMAATPRRNADWIDAPRDPKLRGRMAGK